MIITMIPNNQHFSHQWRTSIQKGINGKEKRSSLFTWPRMRLSTGYILPTYSKHSWMRKNLYKYIHDFWEIPIWYDRTVLTSEATSGQKVLEVEHTGNRHFYDGRECILIGSASDEQGTVGTIDSDTQITLSDNLVATWPIGTSVLPLYKFRIQSVQEIKGIQEYPLQTISFDALEEFESARSFSYSPPSSGLGTYLGHDLFLFLPKQVNPTVISSYSRPYELLQMLGLGYGTTHYDETEFGLKLSFVLTTKQDSWDLLKAFDSKRGRLTPFWIPSWNKDIIVTSAIADTDTVLTITDINYNSYYFSNDIINRHIWIRFPDKTYVCRKIISVPSNTSIEIDSAIGTSVSAGNLSSLLISFLGFCRFDVDELSFSYFTKQYDVVNTNVKTKGLVEEDL